MMIPISIVRKAMLIPLLFLTFGTIAPVTAQQDEVQSKIAFYRMKGIEPLLGGLGEGPLQRGTYLIPHDIMIEKGTTVTLAAGTKILFTQNAMLVVNGTLICNGSHGAPVIFQKLDNAWYYQAIDPRIETRWDGMYLPDSAVCKMKNTIITNSKYGIVVSGKNVSMAFDSVQFTDNKFQNVKIGNRVMKIKERSPIVFNYPEQEGVFVEPVAVVNATETIQSTPPGKRSTNPTALRIGMGIAGGVGLILGAAGIYKVSDIHSGIIDEEDYTDELIARLNRARAVGIGGSILFGIGVTGFVWTFFF